MTRIVVRFFVSLRPPTDPPESRLSKVMRYDRSCRCPSCRLRLTGLRCSVRRCPRCRRELPPGQVWKDRRYPGLIELRASPVAAVVLSAGIVGTAIALAWPGREQAAMLIAGLFSGGVALLCLTLGLMRWTMHRAAGSEQRVW